MAKGYDIGPRIAIEGDAEFKKSIGQINAGIKTLGTELQAVSSQFDKADRSEAALTAQNEVLNKQLAAQKERLALLSGHLEKVATVYGVDCKEAQKLAQEINHTKTAINELSRGLESNTAEIKAQADAVANALAGEAAFQTSITKTESAIKTLKTELKAVESAYASNDKSVEALTARQRVLTSLHEEEKNKLAQLKSMLAEASAKYGEADERTQAWARQVNEAQAEVNQLGQELSRNEKGLQDVQRGYNDAGQAVDKFGQEIKQTGTELSKSQQDLKRVQETAGTVGANLNSMGNTLTMGLTAPLAAAGTAAFHFASDTDESLNKVQVAFGDAAGTVEKFSDTSLNTYGLAKGTALDMAALYGDMATSMGYSQSAAADMSKTLVGLAADLASFKNISIDEANTALKSIFTGETESFKNLGVVMTQTNLDAYAMAQGFQTAYKDMDQTQQVAVRLQYVLEKTQNAQGDFARTSDGAANQLRILQESLKEAAATAGNDLLPIITPIITNLSGMAQSFGELDEGTRKAIVQTGLFLAALGPMLKVTGGLATAVKAGAAAYYVLTAAKGADATATGVQAAATTAATAAKGADTTATAAQAAATATATAAKAAHATASGVQAAATTTATVAQTGLNAAMNANPIGIVATAIGMLVAGLAAFGVSAALASEKQEDFNTKLHETVEASDKAAESIRDDAAAKTANLDAVRDLLPQIEALNSKTTRTSEEQHRLNGLVEIANNLYPGLIGQVDELTGSYDFNRAAVEGNINALKRQLEVEANQSIVEEKYRNIALLKQDLIKADAALVEAEKEVEAQQAAFNEAVSSNSAAVEGLAYSLTDAKAKMESAEATVADYDQQIATLTADADALITTNVDLAVATQETASAAEEATQAYDGFSAGLTAFDTVLETVQGAYELLSKAQKETEETGYLNIETVSTLLEKYPKLTSYLEETTGGYSLTDGALQDYIASQKEEADLALGNAQAAAQAVIDAEIEKRGAIIDTTLSVENQLQALATMYGTIAKTMGTAAGAVGKLAGSMVGLPGIAGDVIGKAMDTSVQDAFQQQAKEIQAAADNLHKAMDEKKGLDRAWVSLERERKAGDSKGSSKSSGRSSKKEKTQAELELEAYKTAKKELDHLRATGRISDEAYYEQGTALASQHLEEQSDERRKWDEEVYQYQQKAYDRDLAELDRQLQAQEITRDEYHGKAVVLQKKYFQENSQEWLKADEKNRAFREESYKKELEQLKFYRDQGLISEREFCDGMGRLRDTYLEENSDAWQDATLEMHEANQKMLDDQRKVLEEYQKSLDARKDALMGFVGLFDEIASDSEVTGRELLSNLRGQVSAFEGWQKDMETLAARGVTGPLLEELQEMGPKAAQEIRALTQLADHELEQYRDLYTEKINLAAEQAEKEIPPVTVPLEAGELDLSGIQAQADVAGIRVGVTGGGEALTEAIAPTTKEMSAANQWLATIKEFTAGIDTQGKLDAATAQERFRQQMDQLDKEFSEQRRNATEQMQTIRYHAQSLDATLRACAADMAARISAAADQITTAVSQIEINITNNYSSGGGSGGILSGGDSPSWGSVDFDYDRTEYAARASVLPGASALSGTGESITRMGEAIVNGLASILPRSSGSRRTEIPLSINSREVARAIYDDLEDEGKRRGR